MLMVTTPTIEGHPVRSYLGLVSGDAILGANVFKDLLASIRDVVGGRSAAYERVIREAKVLAFEEMASQARDLGANAVLGVDLDYETVAGGRMLMVSTSGTAVLID